MILRRVTLIATTSLTLSPTVSAAAATSPDDVTFDSGMIERRGLNQDVGAYFRHGARFAQGSQRISLSINGRERGQVTVNFSSEGQLCVSPEFADAAGLIVPPALGDRLKAHAACLSPGEAFPGAIVRLQPTKNHVDIVVSSDLLRPIEADDAPSAATAGGVAGMLNYDMTAIVTKTRSGTLPVLQTNVETGFNAGDWIVRSQHMLAAQRGSSLSIEHTQTYAQHTFVKQGTLMQAGEIYPRSPLFAIDKVIGMQTFSEEALAPRVASGAFVNGIAKTEAHVEVRQLGVLIDSMLVPPGPFTLRSIRVLNGNADLDVTVIEANGERRTFSVPAAALSENGLDATPGTTIAVGRLEPNFDESRKPWIATASTGIRLGRAAQATVGALVAAPYRALGMAIDFAPLYGVRADTQLNLSQSRAHRRGMLSRSTLSSTWQSPVSLNLSVTRRTPGYRELADILPRTGGDFAGDSASQITAGAAWSSQRFGALSGTWSQSRTFSGDTFHMQSLFWSRTFRYASVSVNLSRNTGRRTHASTQVYASIDIPLGRRSVSTYASRSDDTLQLGSTFTDRVSDAFSYTLSADKTLTDDRRQTVRASMYATPRYLQVNTSVGRYGADTSMATLAARGGVLVHRHGVTFSPRSIGDTIGIVKIGDEPNIALSTPSGTVWTDRAGQAAIGNLSAYQDSTISVQTRRLPKNLDVVGGVRHITPGRGSVNLIDFSVVHSRRVIPKVALPDGRALPDNTSISDASGRLVTISNARGTVVLGGNDAASELYAAPTGAPRCRLVYDLPARPPITVKRFERADATCTP